MIRYRTIDSPIGPLTLAGSGSALTNLRMVDQTHEPSHAGWSLDQGAFSTAVEQLGAYFAGELVDFDMELDLRGTEFQRRVWQVDDPVRGNAVLRGDRRTDRSPGCRTRRGIGQRPQPDRDRRSVSPGNRRQRKPHRLRWRTRPKTNPTRIREATG